MDLTSDAPVDEATAQTQTVAELEEQLTLVEEELLDVSTPLETGSLRNAQTLCHDANCKHTVALVTPVCQA